ncbi:hypothetical protein ETD83_09495 [Actinomadura soli]|uniref:Uncharacterized protein n=1 Tax=Actinomadura soli TaxID=2508997 RepID=A0A5C4JFD7_9ACTN|nr:hypothetical protein [Actinomadura soli]TMR03826.1 hypothetical protein ETD83_09495 [Actinomadura soli]
MNSTASGAWQPDTAAYLAELRAEFPTFGIIADPGRPLWMAVKGNEIFIRASDGIVLRQRLLEIANR